MSRSTRIATSAEAPAHADAEQQQQSQILARLTSTIAATEAVSTRRTGGSTRRSGRISGSVSLHDGARQRVAEVGARQLHEQPQQQHDLVEADQRVDDEVQRVACVGRPYGCLPNCSASSWLRVRRGLHGIGDGAIQRQRVKPVQCCFSGAAFGGDLGAHAGEIRSAFCGHQLARTGQRLRSQLPRHGGIQSLRDRCLGHEFGQAEEIGRAAAGEGSHQIDIAFALSPRRQGPVLASTCPASARSAAPTLASA